MALAAEQFSTEISGTTSTGILLAGNLLFNATSWRVRNFGTVPVRFSLESTTPTTGDYEIGPGITEQFLVPPTAKFGVLTTSTSTDGLDHRRVQVLAVGG